VNPLLVRRTANEELVGKVFAGSRPPRFKRFGNSPEEAFKAKLERGQVGVLRAEGGNRGQNRGFEAFVAEIEDANLEPAYAAG
jgi:hypothetical protein